MRSMRQVTTALVLVITFLGQGSSALAGVTGGITGSVVDADSGAPIAGAKITASSPSQAASVVSDASGHFGFLTLGPDTYTITVEKGDYQPTSVPGQIVFADTVQTVAVRLTKLLKTIAHVTSAAAGSLVKSGTTADVYSINAATQRATSALGGGGNLNSAYSAITTVPGAYVVPNQSGYFDTVHIRGGDFDQVGYEFDGVPVNRSFDNYPSGAASSLGNAEVQVYTGATPADSEGQGLAGYVNQVIRTGTFPGFADAQLGIGTPTYYHRAEVEAGGATPDRLLSYYFGVAGYNQGFRYVNNDNGSNYDNWLGQPLAPMANPLFAAGGYDLGPFNWMNFATIASRDVVANIHIGIPHRNDAGRDDVQILWDSSYLQNSFYSSNNDVASPQCSPSLSGAQCWGNVNPLGRLGLAPNLPAGATTPYVDGLSWNCQNDVGGTFTVAQLLNIGPNCTSKYFYPFSSHDRPFSDFATGSSYGFVPNSERDSSQNQQEIVKIQYTKNLGSSAFFRLYGYTYYSTWDLVGPQCTAFFYACPTAPDYELSSHTRGLSGQFQDQIDPENLISLQGSYVTASTIRDNNTQMFNNFPAFGGPLRTNAAVVVNAADPYSGFCYGSGGGTPVSCSPNVGAAQFATWDQLYEPNAPLGTGNNNPPGLPNSCVDPRVPGKTACTYLLAENGQYATYNNVQPKFGSASLTDQFRPNDKILINLGVRLDSFTFDGLNGDINGNGGIARQFWYNAYNQDTCVNNLTGVPVDKSGIGKGLAPTAPCPAGYSAAALQNQAYQSFTFNEWQPRFSGTYTLSPDTVIRASFGRYTEAPNTAYEIYNTLEADIPFALLGPNLYPYGRTSPGLPVQPPTSLNYDVSLEQHVKGTDWSFKITPFLRQTQDQVQNFFLNQATGFISGLNVGSQRSEGVEFQMQKGDFSRNGISGLLSFAYTNSYTKYGVLSNGTTIISPINATISNYNDYTRACAKNGAFVGKSQYGIPLCGANSGGIAAKCYKNSAPVSCGTPGAVINPYWNSPAQNFLNPGQNFAPYDIFPAGIGSSVNAFNSPYVASMVLNYKHDRLALTPSFQFQGGGKYGAPETTPGIDPAGGGCVPLVGSHRYDASSCPTSLVIPDPFTGVFDDLGSFTQPNEFMVNFQASYDVSPRITFTAVLANIINTCWGGSKQAWTYTDNNICSYGVVGNGLIPPVGNAFNPVGTTSKANGKNAATNVQQFLLYPYEPALGPFLVSGLNNSVKAPFQAYFTANIKL